MSTLKIVFKNNAAALDKKAAAFCEDKKKVPPVSLN
jgi:hypothetical protein